MPEEVWTTGAPPVARDRLDGLYLAVFFEGNLVREYGMPSGVVEAGRKELGLDRK